MFSKGLLIWTGNIVCNVESVRAWIYAIVLYAFYRWLKFSGVLLSKKKLFW